MLLKSAATAMASSSSPQTGECSSLPVCPVCGGLNCLCRPRFFAGQLLTEDDLNRLEQYVIDKNRLHNRYLHGWGVVCGLEVVCNNCAGMVTVRAGYALSPCGDDIVVCKDASVNVCDLIQRCRQPTATPDCAPPFTGNDPNCADVIEDWILAICYDETTSRGRIALRGASGGTACGCGCSSSGSSGRASGCGCGCHSNGSTSANSASRSTATATRSHSVASQCEPTLICEGYKFIAYKAPAASVTGKNQKEGVFNSELIQKIFCCLQDLISALPATPANLNNQTLYAWICDVKTAMLDLLANHPIYDCTAYQRLGQILCPVPGPNELPGDYQARVVDTLIQIAEVTAEYIRYCFCSALLPPCPPPANSACVPLATVTVRRSDCQIQRVCNWGPRRFVTTFPYIGYLLSITGIMEKLRAALELACCTPFRQKTRALDDQQKIEEPNVEQPAVIAENRDVIRQAAASPAPEAAPAATGSVSQSAINLGSRQVIVENKPAFAPFFMQSWLNSDRQIDAQTYFLGLTGATDAQGNPLVSERELASPVSFLFANQLVQPTLNAALPDELTGLLQILAARGTGKDTLNTNRANSETPAPSSTESKPPPTSDSDLAELRRMVVELQSQVKTQSEEIASLRETSRKTGGRKP